MCALTGDEVVGPRIYKTVASEADKRIPRMARIKLECHIPWVSQCAPSTVVHEKAPITAAAKTVQDMVVNCSSVDFRARQESNALVIFLSSCGVWDASLAMFSSGALVLNW